MPSITLQTTSARLTSQFGSTSGALHAGKWRLTLGVRLPLTEHLRLGTGEEEKEREMRLTFREEAAELTDWAIERTKDVEDIFKSDDEGVIGIMSYHPEWSDSDGFDGGPASVLFEIFTPSEVLNALIRFAENGRFPGEVRVEILGLQYGYAPDGSEKKWLDNAEVRVLPVVNVDFELPLEREPEELEPGTPTTPLGADLAPLLSEALKWIKGAVWLLALLALFAIFRETG